MHHMGGDGYESTRSSIGDSKDMMTNYMNQLNENINDATLNVNFLKCQQIMLSTHCLEHNPTRIVCKACNVSLPYLALIV